MLLTWKMDKYWLLFYNGNLYFIRISYTFSWGNWTVRSFGTEDECPGYVCYYFDENGVECSEVFGEIVWQM